MHARFAGPLRRRTVALAVILVTVVGLAPGSLPAPATASAAVSAGAAAPTARAAAGAGTGSIEAAASRAGDTGRKVAMSLIGLGFAVAAIVLTFKRDFREAAGILAIGLVAVLLATPAGLNLLRNTVTTLVG